MQSRLEPTIASIITASVTAYDSYHMSKPHTGVHDAITILITAVIAGAATMFLIFMYNCIRWRNLPDPPRHLKWKQRERLAEALRRTEPQTVFMHIWDGVEDARALADEVKACFRDGGWAVDIGNQQLTDDPVHEYGIWVVGQSLGEKASKARELVGTAFRTSKFPIHIDRKTSYAGGPNAEIVIGKFDEHPDSGDLNP